MQFQPSMALISRWCCASLHSSRILLASAANSVVFATASIPGRQPHRCYPGGVKKVPDVDDHPKRRRGRHVHPIPHGQFRGFNVNEGSIVRANDVVLRQVGLQFYPGENVRLNRENWDLVAVTDGRLLLSTELLEPFPDSPLYEIVKAGQAFEKVFVHVVRMPEDELGGNYKLVSMV